MYAQARCAGLLIAVMLVACGGGGGSGGGTAGTTSAGLWSGNGCCIRLDPFQVTGTTGDAGDYRFILYNSHYVGKLNGALTTYSYCDCLAGGVRSDTLDFKFLGSTASGGARISITSDVPGGKSTFTSDIPMDASFKHASSTAYVQGVYMATTGTYTLTFAIDAAGHLDGSDTNGCVLAGNVATTHPGVDAYQVSIDVTSCGDRNGKYDGDAALFFDTSGQPTGLFLSASNSLAAIGWTLSR